MSIRHRIRLLLNTLIFLCVTYWLSSSCFHLVNEKSEVKIIVQDPTGNSVPRFRFALLGIKSSYPRRDVLEQFDLTTDQAGKVSQTLSWPKGVTAYEISHTALYVTCKCLPTNEIPAPYCHIGSDWTGSTTIQVKKL